MKLAKDDSARVPFSAIGVLLLSTAIVVTAMLAKLDTQVARETAREPEILESAELLASARQDVARLLSWSVQGAASDVARAPVVAGFRGAVPGGFTPEECASSEWCVSRFNEQRVRLEALRRLKGYLAAFNATYRQGESRATVRLPENWTNLTLAPVNMTVQRTLNPPLWGPKGDSEAYWLARVPVNFTVTKPGQKTYLATSSQVAAPSGLVYRETAPIESFVPARFPFVRNLTEGFARERLQGGPVFWEFTGGSLGRVWAKGYLQWAGGGEGDVYGAGGARPNEDVERLLNGVLLLDQGFQFQTVDPGSLWSLLPDGLRRGFESAGDLAKRAGETIETVASLEELLAGPEAAGARKEMRKPRSADEFLVCPFEPIKADIPASTRDSCKTTPEDDGACGLCRSDAIRDKIRDIASQAYSAEIRVDLSRTTGSVGSCPGASGWRYAGHSCSATSAPPGALGADVCSVSYTRTCTETQGEETTTYSQSRSDTVNVRFVASDYSRTNLDLSAAGLPGSTGSDVAGAFSQTTFNGKPDLNLADALSKYRAQHWRFEDQRQVLSDPGSSGVPSKSVTTDVPTWLKEAAEGEVRDLLDRFKQVRTNPETTPENQSHYADYLRNVSRELSAGMKDKAPGFAERGRFADGGTYRSAAAKALYLSRAWFVDDAVRRTREFGEEGAKAIDESIDGLLKKAGRDREPRESAGDAIRKAGEFLKGAASFPLGLNMTLSVSNESANRSGWARGWNETVRLDVDQRPDWLSGSETEGFIPLKIRTWSLPASVPPLVTRHGGVAILPTLTPWVVTANAWVVHVEGEFALTVEDAGGKVWNGTEFEGVKWVREERKEINDPVTIEKIGENQRVKFDFWTVLPIVVPPGPWGVGDAAGGEPLSCSPPSAC